MSKLGLSQHIENIHEKKKTKQCPKCGAYFGRTGDFNKHFSSVHEEKRPFKCIVCEATFKRKGHMESHSKLAHEENKNYVVLFVRKNSSKSLICKNIFHQFMMELDYISV